MQVEPSKLEEITLPAPSHPITIWSITGCTGQIRYFCLQIHDPLKKWVQKHCPNWRRSSFKPLAFCEYFVFYNLIRKNINLGPPDLENMHLVIYDISILDPILCAPPSIYGR